ncbi:MAG: hypothetical protein ACOCRX_07620 [Candidatus Woesearchaeota archaeon]
MKNSFEIKITPEHFKESYGWLSKVDFEWHILTDYKINKNEKDKKIISGKGHIDEANTYEPLIDEKYLFLKFAKLGRSLEKNYSEEKVIDWVKNYGVLGLEGVPVKIRTEEGDKFHPKRREHVDTFLDAAKLSYRLLNLYEAVWNNDKKMFESNIEVKKEPPGVWVTYFFGDPWYENKLEWKKHFNPSLEWYKKKALNFIFNKTTEQLKLNNFFKDTPHITKYGMFYHIDPQWSCPNLWTAMIAQFYGLLNNLRNKRICLLCGKLFTPKKKTAKLCKECRKKGGRSTLKYHRDERIKQYLREGKSVEEIQELEPAAKRDTIQSFKEKIG